MNKLLYEIYRDAIEKLRSSTEDEQRILIDTASDVLTLSELVRHDGLLAMEEAVQDWDSKFGKELVHFTVDGTDPDRLLELASNLYWIEDPQGIQAMIDYLYLRGMLLIRAGEQEYLMKETFRTLIPKKWREEYVLKIECIERNAEILRQKEISEEFSKIYSVFQDAHTIENVHLLEKEIESLSDRDLQRVVRDVDHQHLAACVYAVNTEMREKILNNVSKRLTYVIMEEVVSDEDRNEEIINENVMKVIGIIHTLRERGVLHQK